MAETAIVHTVEVATEDGRIAAIEFHRRRPGCWSVDISDELVRLAPEGLTAALVLAFRELGQQNGRSGDPS